MIVGTTVLKLDGNPYHTPQFARGGLATVFVIDVTHLASSNNLTLQIQHKNSEDTSFSNVAGASASTAIVDTLKIEATGLKEEVRIEVTFDSNDPALAGAHFVVQAPTWRPY